MKTLSALLLVITIHSAHADIPKLRVSCTGETLENVIVKLRLDLSEDGYAQGLIHASNGEEGLLEMLKVEVIEGDSFRVKNHFFDYAGKFENAQSNTLVRWSSATLDLHYHHLWLNCRSKLL